MEKLEQAIINFKQVWGDGYLLADIAQSLTCTEYEALADLLLEVGVDSGVVQAFGRAHAEGDDCGDDHCVCSECKEEGLERG